MLFDGVCNLCNAWVRFVIDRDPGGRFAFAPLQSELAERLLRERGYVGEPLATVLLVDGPRVYDRSTAALRIVRGLRGGWPMLAALLAVPRALRDPVYGWLARRRYRWFGRTETCRLPSPEIRDRFLA